MNIFWREIKTYRKSVLIWAISLSILVVVFLIMYPAFTSDVEMTRKILASFPVAVRDAIGLSLENFFTIYGFFSYLLTFIVLAGAIQAMGLGVGVLSKEDSGKTADFLLTKPISRFKVLTSKIFAVICLIIFTNIIFDSVALITAKLVSTGNLDIKIFLMLSAILLLVQFMFLALGLFMSVIVPKIK